MHLPSGRRIMTAVSSDFVLSELQFVPLAKRNIKCEIGVRLTMNSKSARPLQNHRSPSDIEWERCNKERSFRALCRLGPTTCVIMRKIITCSKPYRPLCPGAYHFRSNITSLEKQLNWAPLSERRPHIKLNFLYCIYFEKTGINHGTFLFTPHFISRWFDHSWKIRKISSRTNVIQDSFLSHCILIMEQGKISYHMVCSPEWEGNWGRTANPSG